MNDYRFPIYGSGFHTFMMDEVELGTRVAHAIDSEHSMGWSALDDLRFEIWEARNETSGD